MLPALVLGSLAQKRRAAMFNGGLELSMHGSVTRSTTFAFFCSPHFTADKAHGVGEPVHYACIV